MARRIGFFHIVIASFSLTVAATLPFQARGAEPAAVQTRADATTVDRVAALVQERHAIAATRRSIPR